MKYSVTVKFIAIILCACSLVAMAFSGIGIAFMEGYDLYRTPLEDVQLKNIQQMADSLAREHAEAYAYDMLSNVPEDLQFQLVHSYYSNRLTGYYHVEILENGKSVRTAGTPQEGTFTEFTLAVSPNYPIVSSEYYYDENGAVTYSATDAAEPAAAAEEAEAARSIAQQEILYSEELHGGYYHDEQGHAYQLLYNLDYYQGPEYEVILTISNRAVLSPDFMLVSALYPYRDYFIPTLLAGLAAFAITFVFLCTVAGRTKKGEVKLAAINRIPLDLYGVCCVGLAVLFGAPVMLLLEAATHRATDNIWDNPQLCLLICCLCGLGIGLAVIGFLYAFAAQIKASDNYWLRHTVIGWCFRQLGSVLRWLGKGLKALGRGCCFVGRGIRAVFVMLPTIWQWLTTAFAMALTVGFSLLLAIESYDGLWVAFWTLVFIGSLFGSVAIVCYGGWCFGKLLKGIETMSQGDLHYQIDTKYLYGTFKDLAVQLNSLAGAAQLAAERQMKSERMKTELITNVSHDIKTPLTSIINFVDLMKKPHTEAEGAEYLAVLDRQSQRLKKLIDDLMDMSKASSGNVTVELGTVDAAEAINQALGEFADKLDRVNLTPVFRHPEKTVTMIADGKHLWRVLSNLLNNAVKYALPDTRLYIDLMELQGNAVIAIKNISREQLNVNADELMERFVRGDASRNTEGSGLGLNIAKSLVELQGGQMHLMVDGDLFKVTLIFPQR